MRDRLIEDFRPDHDQGYTYKELLALRAAGKDIPDQWIIRAKRTEDADAEDRELSKAIAADLKAAEKAWERNSPRRMNESCRSSKPWPKS